MKKIESILYVEDEKNIQEELKDVLQMFCEKLYLADDGFQGLKLYNKFSPNIIISDIKMPIMDGIEMSKKIKNIDKNIPIIFTTAFSDVEFFQEAIDLQVEGYLLKPINLELLEKKINSVIEELNLKKELKQKEDILFETSKLASMGEMLENISHQWRQPLSAITTCASGLKLLKETDNLSDDEFYKTCDIINERAKYLSETIEDFRTYLKPTKNKEEFNLKQCIHKCIGLVSSSFEKNTIKTIENIDDQINSYGNPNQLLQAIVNILNNAKDALEEASHIRKKLIFIVTINEDKNKIIITIKDNAGGIPENLIGRIFEPYFTTKTDEKGTGIGLYISHCIITKKFHGTIKVENEIFEYEGVEYKGAKFIITLPL